MDDNERIEYLGLAATVGRLMASIKQLEERIAELTKQLEPEKSK